MKKNINDLQKELEQLDSLQLQNMLHQETEKDTPDDDLVLAILGILEDRDKEKPVELGPQSQDVWDQFKRKKYRNAAKKNRRYTSWAVKAASILLVIGALTLAFVPQQATAGSFWKILTSWTDDFFQYENIGAEETEPEEYVFQSDNPGLQQVYEAVVEELGITEPVVPTWLPGEYVLVELQCLESPAMKCVHARFKNGEKEIVLMLDKMVKDLSPSFNKIDSEVVEFERKGIVHNFIRNTENWVISWTRQNIKCSIFIDCQEDILADIVRSIY